MWILVTREDNEDPVASSLLPPVLSGDRGLVHSSRLSSAEGLAVAWLEQRTRAEMQVYPPLIELGHKIIEEAFSSSVVKPGQTLIADVAWWMWQKLRDLGLKAWFRPMVALNRPGGAGMQWQGVIERGDLLFCDLGIGTLI
ncbi:MAG: aminopeptidase P family protein [Firmicutes bacterium]|nr:aminopeptidase P family protein [Bacillota bacterium]